MDDKRDFKTHPQQWNTIVNFGEEHPTIFRPQFKHMDGDARQNAKLWEELVEKLNSTGFGLRSVGKWKMAIGRWKSKTKSKAAQLRIEAQKTGGGPSNAVPLTETEERLMNLMGWKSVTGDGNAELGMRPIAAHLPLPQPQHLTDEENGLPPPKAHPSNSTGTEGATCLPKSPHSPPPLKPFNRLTPPKTHPSSIETDRAAHLPKSSPPLTSSSGPARKRSRKSAEKPGKVVSLAKMHEEAMAERRKLREMIKRQAEAQEAIAQALKDLSACYRTQNNIKS